jgi:hypothetical protein
MERLIVFLTLAVFLVAATATAQVGPAGKPIPGPKARTSFSDNFNDGDTVGWSFTEGTWAVEDGALVNLGLSLSDYQYAIVDNLSTSSQTIEVTLNVGHSLGDVCFWRADNANQVCVQISYYHQRLIVAEVHDTIPLEYDYGGIWAQDTWYRLRVDADSTTGDVRIWVNNVYLFTYSVQSPHRSGMVALYSGAGGTRWDDFRVGPLRKK